MNRRTFLFTSSGAAAGSLLVPGFAEAMKSAVHLSSEPKRFSIACRTSSAGSGAFGASPSK